MSGARLIRWRSIPGRTCKPIRLAVYIVHEGQGATSFLPASMLTLPRELEAGKPVELETFPLVRGLALYCSLPPDADGLERATWLGFIRTEDT